MLRFIKKLLFTIGYLIPGNKHIKDIRNIIYSGYISKRINIKNKVNFSCEFPISISGGKNIYIKSGHIREKCRISAISIYNDQKFTPMIQMGDNICLGKNCHIGIINRIIIGDNFLTGANCLITDHSHGNSSKEELPIPPNFRPIYSKGIINIGKNVFIGENVVILNCSIGDNVTIGASSVVTKDIPSNCIVAGNPAKIIKCLC